MRPMAHPLDTIHNRFAAIMLPRKQYERYKAIMENPAQIRACGKNVLDEWDVPFKETWETIPEGPEDEGPTRMTPYDGDTVRARISVYVNPATNEINISGQLMKRCKEQETCLSEKASMDDLKGMLVLTDETTGTDYHVQILPGHEDDTDCHIVKVSAFSQYLYETGSIPERHRATKGYVAMVPTPDTEKPAYKSTHTMLAVYLERRADGSAMAREEMRKGTEILHMRNTNLLAGPHEFTYPNGSTAILNLCIADEENTVYCRSAFLD